MNTLANATTADDASGGPSPYRRATPTLLQHIGRSIWAALETVGQRRAARELLQLADRREPFDPELARLLRASARFDKTQ